ncbi:hypothetical protein [Deinococcus sp.]|uniref:hypothetical protein n=1 Tax=Deinococcus sp. TaxID=47478 RepID=UPI00391DD557
MTRSSNEYAPTPAVQAIGEMHLEGNIIPHTFYTRREFRSDRNVTQHLAILCYADDLYWYRPTEHRDPRTGQVTHYTRKFDGDMLQRDYGYYAALFGVTKEQAKAAVHHNVMRGLTRREFRTVQDKYGKPLPNVMFVEPNVAALRELLRIDEPGAAGLCWVAEPPKINERKPRKGDTQGGVWQIDAIRMGNRSDTLPEIDAIRMGNRSHTNTETTQETSSQTSQRGGDSRGALGNATVRSRVRGARDAAPSSSKVAARKTAGPQITTAPQAPTPPDGGAADAAGQGTHAPSQVQDQPPVRTVSQATRTEQVPWAAGGPSGDQGGPAAPSVDALRPVPTSELSTRVSARPESLEYKALLTLFGKNLGGYLQEYTRTGSIPRTQWLHLTLAELNLVRDTAQGEARATQGNMLTLAVRGLDRLIGAVSTPRTAGSGTRPAAPTVTPNGSSLSPAAPLEQVADVASTDRYGSGARWEARTGGTVVTIQRTSDKPTKTGKTTLYHLSDGRAVNAMELMRDFDHVG